MDKVFLEGIHILGHGGVTDSEKEIGQHYIVDVSLDVDLTEVAISDDLAHTVDFVEVVDIVREALAGPGFNLLESKAAQIGNAIVMLDRVGGVTVRLRKAAPPLSQLVDFEGVEVRKLRS